MAAYHRGRLADRHATGSGGNFLPAALDYLSPARVSELQAEGIDVRRRLGELSCAMRANLGDAAPTPPPDPPEIRSLFAGWLRDGIHPRTCSKLLLTLREALYAASAADGGLTAEQRIRLDSLFLRLADMSAQEIITAYEEALEGCNAALEEVEQFPLDIAAMVDPNTLARSAVSRFFDLTRARCVVLARVDAVGRLTPRAGTPAGEAMLSGFAPCLPENCMHALLGEGRIARSTVGELNPSTEAAPDGREVLMLPLRARGRTTDVALLAESLTGKGFPEITVRMARHFASRVGVALENARLHAAEQKKIDEALGLLELAHLTSSAPHLRRMLKQATVLLAGLCGASRCEVWLRDPDGRRYRRVACNVEEEGQRPELAEEVLPGAVLLASGKTVTLDPEEAALLGGGQGLKRGENQSAALYPLVVRDTRHGFVAFFSDSSWVREGSPLAETAVGQIAMALENAHLYRNIEKSYFCTVKALAKAIEVKDPYTHGHSERVTRFALAIGEEMRLSEAEMRNLKYGATLHDIGKIGIAGRVLNKNGSLDPEEYEHVKTHPALGDSIIADVEFLQAPRHIILHHHERYDGTGYPQGLKGEEIPLEARILAVADAFEAMLSRRPYRMPRSFLEATRELRLNAGTQFDPRIVELFLKLLERNPQLMEEDRKRRMDR